MFEEWKPGKYEFLSTPSARRATFIGLFRRDRHTDFYPRPPRGGRRGIFPTHGKNFLFLSTPSARRATQRSRGRSQRCGISIHALREEGDLRPVSDVELRRQFLSTPSARRATQSELLYLTDSRDFYPRPPRGGRLPLCAGCKAAEKFLSTPSARRATRLARVDEVGATISIHALREEGDAGGSTHQTS